MMGESKFDLIKHFKEARHQIWELVALVFALSFAVNLLSTIVFDIWGRTFALVLGIILIISCTAYVVASRSRGRLYETNIEAAFIVDYEDQGNVLNMPGYKFGREFSSMAKAVFEENSAFKAQWTDGPFVNYKKARDDVYVKSAGTGVKLITEIAEYIILSQLSTNLSDYFNDSKFNKNRVATLGRSDLPHVLLSNRVLELLSRDVKDRPGFNVDRYEDKTDGWTVIAGWDGDKYYSRFELTLPQGSVVKREEGHSLVIDSPAINLRISTIFTGNGAALPFGYFRYIASTGWENTKSYEVNFKICAKVKNPLFGRQSQWAYYGWLESFIDRTRRDFSYPTLFERIN